MILQNFSVETHQGPYLNINEDGFKFDFDNEMFMIFDGFGGAGIGDKCVDTLKEAIGHFYNNFVFDRDKTLPFFYSSKYLLEGNALINAALLAHHKIYKENLERDISKRGGASGILAVKSESILTILGTGNCRAYIHRKGNILPIFTDDSYLLLSHDHYESHLKNIPLSGFGLFPELHYQVREVRVSEGDQVIFLTDGVYGRLESQEIMSSIQKFSINTKIKIKELFELANNRGNLDNQTCMILEF